MISFEKELSAPRAISRRIWYLIASQAVSFAKHKRVNNIADGFAIFWPLKVIQPCTARCFGSGKSSAISIAGQMIA